MSRPQANKKAGRINSVGRHVSILHRYWQIYIDRALAPLGIGAGQLPILMYLFQHEGVNQAEIVHHLRTDKSSTARTIRKLVDQGYVERLPSPEDGRAYQIRVTAKAHSIHGRLKTILVGWTEAVSQDLSADERAQLFEMLDRMQDRAENLIHLDMAASDGDEAAGV